MFHAFALIHDDAMDSSGTRRGQPTIHRLLEARFARTHALADRRNSA
jgi:geranylgeranyl diphosphate synthase type I